MVCRTRKSPRSLIVIYCSLTPVAQVLELRRLLYDLEELGDAMVENDPEAAHVAMGTAHEIAQLRMFVGGSAHNDPVQLERAVNSRSRSGPEVLHLAFERLANDGHLSPESEARVRALASTSPSRSLKKALVTGL
jgi:hypothetical protein